MGVVQMGKLRENLHHLVGTLAASDHDDDVGLGLLGDGMLQHRLSRTERPRDESRTAVGYRVEGIDRPHARFEFLLKKLSTTYRIMFEPALAVIEKI